MTCTALSIGIVAAYPVVSEKKTHTASAKTLNEIQEERAANDAKIAEYDSKLSELESSKNDEQAYQDTLMEQIRLIKENINNLNLELDKLNEDIENTKKNIDELDKSIIEQQNAIDHNVELFKGRLCDMYVNGNDNLASVILGASDFYSIMSQVEMANRMAEYDENLINGLLNDIDELENSKTALQTEKLTLEMKIQDQNNKVEQKKKDLAELDVKMQKTKEVLDALAMEQQMLESDKAELAKYNADLDAQAEQIREAARKAAEEQQRKAEEAARRAAQQAAQQQAAQQAAQQQAAQQEQSNNNSNTASTETPTYTPPATTYTPPATSTGGFIWPVPGFGYISSPFGYRWGRNHNGVDVGDAGIMGATVVASKGGTVSGVYNLCTHNCAKSYSCGCNGGYGNYVMITHPDGTSTVYGHLSYASVSYGQSVSQGQAIGAVGSTGWSTGAHLHFEIYVGGVPQNPLGYTGP